MFSARERAMIAQYQRLRQHWIERWQRRVREGGDSSMESRVDALRGNDQLILLMQQLSDMEKQLPAAYHYEEAENIWWED